MDDGALVSGWEISADMGDWNLQDWKMTD